MGMDKLLWPLDGVAVLQRAIEAFDSSPAISCLIVVCPADRWELLDHHSGTKPVIRVDGGASRQDSVACGLAAVPADCRWVAVHDGARPLVSPDDIARCVDAARTHRAAALAKRVAETVKRSDSDDFCEASVSREHLWAMETPQVFSSTLLREACELVARENLTVTDEVSAVQALGVRAKLVESSRPNIKITTPADLALATALWKTFQS